MPQRGKLRYPCLSAPSARLLDASLLRARRCLPRRLLKVVPQNRDGSVHIRATHCAGSSLPASLRAICPLNCHPLVGSLVARIRRRRIAERCCDCAPAEVSARLTARQQCIIRIIGNQQISPAAGLSACPIRIVPGDIYQIPHAADLSKIPHMPAASPALV